MAVNEDEFEKLANIRTLSAWAYGENLCAAVQQLKRGRYVIVAGRIGSYYWFVNSGISKSSVGERTKLDMFRQI